MTAIGLLLILIGRVCVNLSDGDPWDSIWTVVWLIGSSMLSYGIFVFLWRVMP